MVYLHLICLNLLIIVFHLVILGLLMMFYLMFPDLLLLLDPELLLFLHLHFGILFLVIFVVVHVCQVSNRNSRHICSLLLLSNLTSLLSIIYLMTFHRCYFVF